MVDLLQAVLSQRHLCRNILGRLSAYQLDTFSCCSTMYRDLAQDVLRSRPKKMECVSHRLNPNLECIKTFCKEELQIHPAYCILFLTPQQKELYNTVHSLRSILVIPNDCQVFIITIEKRETVLPDKGGVTCAFIPRGFTDFAMEPIKSDHVEFPSPHPRLAVLIVHRHICCNLLFDPEVVVSGINAYWSQGHIASLQQRYNLRRQPTVEWNNDDIFGFVFRGQNVKVTSVVRNDQITTPEAILALLKKLDERPQRGASSAHNYGPKECVFAFRFTHQRDTDYEEYYLHNIHLKEEQQFATAFPGVPLISLYSSFVYGHEHSTTELRRSRRNRDLIMIPLVKMTSLDSSVFVMVFIDYNE